MKSSVLPLLCIVFYFLLPILYKYREKGIKKAVPMTKPYIRSLNNNQLSVLAAIYSFRFSTRSLLSQYYGIPNNTSLYSRLQILQKHGYIASHYSKGYKLAGREAEFYMLPSGLRALRDAKLLDVTDSMLTALYKDRSVGLNFISQQVSLLRLRNKLVRIHDNLQAFTIRDTQTLDYFPKPRPDLFLSLKNNNAVTRFFVEYVPAETITSKIRKRLEQLTRYYEEDLWADTGTPFPGILFVAETGLMEAGLKRLISREQYRSDTDIEFYTTTQKAVLGITEYSKAIWTGASDPDELLALSEI